MHTSEDCLRLIEKARACGTDPESAYLLRTRVKRAILSATRLAAASVRHDAPSLPIPIEVVTDSRETAEVFKACNQLIAVTRELCQPSEALDCRWRDGWSEVLRGLERLEAAVTAFGPLAHGRKG